MFQLRKLGKHEDVLIGEFGKGDILITKARLSLDSDYTMVMFHNNAPIGVGTVVENKATNSDELEKPDLMLRFLNAESIRLLIDTLIELEGNILKNQTVTGIVKDLSHNA